MCVKDIKQKDSACVMKFMTSHDTRVCTVTCAQYEKFDKSRDRTAFPRKGEYSIQIHIQILMR